MGPFRNFWAQFRFRPIGSGLMLTSAEMKRPWNFDSTFIPLCTVYRVLSYLLLPFIQNSIRDVTAVSKHGAERVRMKSEHSAAVHAVHAQGTPAPQLPVTVSEDACTQCSHICDGVNAIIWIAQLVHAQLPLWDLPWWF